jgi:O-antigen/teichoic acid export membrane protein
MQLTKNAAYLFSARFVNALCIMGIILIVSRKLGPDVFGGYAFLNAVIMTGVVIANFGLDTLMVREVSRDSSQGNHFLSTVLGFKVISSLLVMAGIYALFKLFLDNEAMIRLLAVFLIVICLNSLSQSFWFYGDAFQKFEFHAVLWAFLNVIKLALVWLAVLFKQDLATVIYALVVAEIISLIISGYWVRLHFKLVLRDLSLKSVTLLLKKGWPLALVFIASAIYLRVDVMMLEVMQGEKAVGIYSAAYKLIEFLGIIPATITVAALPGLASDYSTNIKAFRTSSYRTLTVLGAGGGAIGLLLYLFSKQIVLLLYGPRFLDSVLSLNILSGAIFFLFVNGYLAYVTIAANNDKRVALIFAVCTILNIIFNFYLIPKYSHVGAALSKLLSEILMLVFFLLVFAKRDIFVKPPRPLGRGFAERKIAILR